MIVLDKIKAFFKWCGEGIMGFLEAKPEAKVAKKKAAEPKAKVAEAPEKKVDDHSERG